MLRFRLKSLILDSSVGCVGLICLRKEEDIAECAKVIDTILLKLKKIPNGPDFSAGIGRVKQGIQYVEDSRWEALLAMRAGRNISVNSKLRTYTFMELGSLCFLSELSNSKAMKAFFHDNLQPLIDYDIANGTELEKTLECYFMNGKNLRKTAEALFMHKNSVIYRIGKIESLLAKSLDDPNTVFELQLCFKLKSIIH
jgi:purine catabolism regulator